MTWATVGTYALSVTEFQDDFAAGTGTSGTVAVGGSTMGEIETGGDRDWFAVTQEAGKTYRIDLEGSDTDAGSLGNPYLRGVHDSDGNRIDGTTNDNGGQRWNSRVHFTPETAGTYYVAAAGAFRVWLGTYTLSVTDVTPPSPAISAPGAPTGLAAAAGDGQVTRGWEAPADAEGITGWRVRHGEVNIHGGSEPPVAWVRLTPPGSRVRQHPVQALEGIHRAVGHQHVLAVDEQDRIADPEVSVSQVARRYDLNTNLVFKWRRGPELRPAVVPELDPCKAILDARLEEFPRHSAQRRFEEARAVGYPGGYSRVRDYVSLSVRAVTARPLRAGSKASPSTTLSIGFGEGVLSREQAPACGGEIGARLHAHRERRPLGRLRAPSGCQSRR